MLGPFDPQAFGINWCHSYARKVATDSRSISSEMHERQPWHRSCTGFTQIRAI